MFPRALLALPHDAVARLGGVRISGRRGAGALFSSFARQVVAHLDDYGVAEGARLGTTMVDVLTAALAARLDGEDELPADTRREALRRRVHAFIEQRLADPACRPRRSPPPTTSRCATCTSCSRAGTAVWPAGSGSGGWSAAAATCSTRRWRPAR